MTKDNCVHILVEGRVQGVGFRYYVKKIAEETGVTGWVRNLYDDRVEILAQGDSNKLNNFIAVVRVGPASAHVTNLILEWLEAEARYERFSIAPTV